MNPTKTVSKDIKQQRTEEILAALDRLLETNGFDRMSLSMIATEAGCTRSCLYKYFKTKEDIFLAYISKLLSEWAHDMNSSCFARKECTAEQFAKTWTDVALRNTKLLELLPALFCILEHNASSKSIVAFKSALYDAMGSIFVKLSSVFPNISSESLTEVLFMAVSAANGLYPMYKAGERYGDLLDRNKVPQVRIDFRAWYENTVRILMSSAMES